MSPRPPKEFDVRRNGEPIEEAYARHKVNAGITYGLGLAGLVPPYLEYAAMVASGFNEVTWQGLGWRQKARAVAWYRANRFEQLHVSDAQAEAMRRNVDD